MNDDRPDQQIDPYDRLLGTLDGLQGTLSTQPTTVQVTSIVGSQTLIIRTIRKQDRTAERTPTDAGEWKETVGPPEFYLFIEYHDARSHLRLAIPPRAYEVIVRQAETLTRRAMKDAARRAAATRKARGLNPPKGVQPAALKAARKKGKAKK